MVSGGCLCGAIRFEVTRFVGPFELCHCSRCRKASGAAFTAMIGVNAEDFSWLSGRDEIRRYEAPVIGEVKGRRPDQDQPPPMTADTSVVYLFVRSARVGRPARPQVKSLVRGALSPTSPFERTVKAGVGCLPSGQPCGRTGNAEVASYSLADGVGLAAA